MKNWSKKLVLNCQIFSQDVFQKYLKIKVLFFQKSSQKTHSGFSPEQLLIINNKKKNLDNKTDFSNV